MILLINVLKHKFSVLFVVFIFFTKNHDKHYYLLFKAY
jgi:hypothetical protein